MNLRLIATCVGAIALGAAASALAIEASTDGGDVDLAPALSVLRDPQGTLALEEVLEAARSGRFERNASGRVLNFGFASDVFWLHVPIEVGEGGTYVLSLGVPTTDRIDFHVRRASGLEPVRRAGLLAEGTEPIARRSPAIALALAPGERVDVFARVESENEVALPVHLQGEADFLAARDRSSTRRGLFYGLLVAMAFYNLLVFAFARERVHLLYALYAGMMGCWLAVLDGTVRVHAPELLVFAPRAAFLLTGTAAFVFAPLFLVSALRLRESRRRLANAFLWGSAATFAVSVLTWVVFGWRAQNVFSTAFALVLMVSGLAVALLRLRDGFAPAAFLFAGWVLNTLGLVVALLSVNGALPPLFSEAIHAGVAGEALCFAMALADDTRRRARRIETLHEAGARFVPDAFLRLLGRPGLPEIARGDQVARVMTVFFSDIRSFTALSERMSPEATLRFVNEYLDFLEPPIGAHGGVVDKYIGDAVMALFERPDDALAAAAASVAALDRLNAARSARGEASIAIGIGIHTGPLVLGTVGTGHRLSCTVIGDTVNVASRIEGLTKQYAATVLISESTRQALADPSRWPVEAVGSVAVRGKSEPVVLHALVAPRGERQAIAG